MTKTIALRKSQPPRKTLIVPGLDGSPAPHWQDWWARIDPTALVVPQADWARPDPDAWEAELAGAILAHPGAIVVGHSLGAVTILRVLDRWPDLQLGGALLVAPAEPSLSPRISAFGPLPRKRLPIPTILAASRNDPWMDFAQAEDLAQAWGADLIDLGAAGHVNVASGYGPWPLALSLRDLLAWRARALVPDAAASLPLRTAAAPGQAPRPQARHLAPVGLHGADRPADLLRAAFRRAEAPFDPRWEIVQ